ncbi:MAG: biopolymer transporter ExbD [Planctomycetes bacterium]|nr:biopolymer transporter ExbD [Planctomycetota bacterium]
MRRADRWSEGPRVEMLPLIDVMFLLLVTFVYSMTVMIRSEAIPVDLPHLASAAATDLPTVLVVTVQADGRLFAAGEEVDGAALGERVTRLRAEDAELAVLVNADADARHAAVAGALDALRGAGQERVWLAGVSEGGDAAR